jgi:hypothetical protein
MKYFLLRLMAGLALAFSAGAQTVQVPVTPTQLQYSNFVFTVNTLATNGGTAFHVTITSQNQPIGSDCVASLALVSGTAAAPVVGSANPPVQMAFKRTDLVWTVDFLAPVALLGDPTADFIFVVPDYKIENDKRVYLPTDRIYEINLQSFLPPP